MQYFQKKVILHSTHLRSGQFYFSSLRVGYLYKLFRILLHGRFFFSSHLCIYSVIYLYCSVVMDIHYILLVIIQYYFILLLKLFQLWPLGAPSVGSCVPLTCLHQCEGFFFCFCFLLIISLLSDIKRCSRLIFYISITCPSPRISQKESVSSSWEIVLEAQIWVLSSCCYWGIIASRSSYLQSRKHMYVCKACIYTYLYIFLYIIICIHVKRNMSSYGYLQPYLPYYHLCHSGLLLFICQLIPTMKRNLALITCHPFT